MNYNSYPSNVDFGNPNEPVTNPDGSQTIPQNMTPLIQQQTISTQEESTPSSTQSSSQSSTQSSSQSSTPSSNQLQNQKNESLYQKIMGIFRDKTGTILSTAIGLAIGFAFKDLVTSTVNNILLPLIVSILSYSTFLNNYLNLPSYISQQNANLSISSFISNLVSFFLTIISVYYVSLLIKIGS
jgi:large-conductance mechanosensitive channel